MEQDEIIGLLRGFQVGDKVTLHSGKMRKKNDAGEDIVFLYVHIRNQNGLGMTPAIILAVDVDEPCHKISLGTNLPTVWAYSDELTHYYEEQND